MRHDHEIWEGRFSLEQAEGTMESDVLLNRVFAQVGWGPSAHMLHAYPLAQVLDQLHNNAWEKRVASCHELGRRADPLSLEPLLLAVLDPIAAVRAAAIEALSAFGENAPLEVMILCLGDAAWEVREAAVFALGHVDQHVPLDLFITTLADPDISVRCAAVWTLEGRKEPLAIAALSHMLQDTAEEVREAAVLALQKAGRLAPIVPIIQTLADSSELVQRAAMQTLTTLETSPCVTALFEHYQKINEVGQQEAGNVFKSCLALALITLQEQVVPVQSALNMLNGAAYKALLTYLFARAINVLNEHTPLEPLFSVEPGEDNILSWRLLYRLTQTVRQEVEWIEMLVAASKEQDRTISVEAQQALIELVELVLSLRKESSQIEPLVAALSDQDQMVAETALRPLVGQALRVLEERASIEPVFTALKDTNVLRRAAAARALAERARQALSEWRSPSEPMVISWKRASASNSLKIQVGRSLRTQTSGKDLVLSWREPWRTLEEKRLVPALSAFLQGTNDRAWTTQWN